MAPSQHAQGADQGFRNAGELVGELCLGQLAGRNNTPVPGLSRAAISSVILAVSRKLEQGVRSSATRRG